MRLAPYSVINRRTKESCISSSIPLSLILAMQLSLQQQNLYLFLQRFGAPFVPPLYGLITSIVLGISRSNHQDWGRHICLCWVWHCNCKKCRPIMYPLALCLVNLPTTHSTTFSRRSISGISPHFPTSCQFSRVQRRILFVLALAGASSVALAKCKGEEETSSDTEGPIKCGILISSPSLGRLFVQISHRPPECINT